jgi:Glutathione S-transferase, N-terminal domain
VPLTWPFDLLKFMRAHLSPDFHDKQDRPMIDLHYWTTPNGHKITMFLEEAGLSYRIFPVNIGKGDQFKPEFLRIAPNNRIPAMVDHAPKGGGKPISIFESGAMLLYLAEKTGKFLPADLYGVTTPSSGHSGRWAGSGRWPARTIISGTTPRKSSNTRSTAT